MPGPSSHQHRASPSYRPHHKPQSNHSHSYTRRGAKDPPGQHAEATSPMTMRNRDVIIPPSSIHVVTSKSSSSSASSSRHNANDKIGYFGKHGFSDVDAPHDEYRIDRQRKTSHITMQQYSPAQAKADLRRMVSVASASCSSTGTPPTSPDDTSASASISASATSDDVSSAALLVINDEVESSNNNPNNVAWVAFSDGHDEGIHNTNKTNGSVSNGPPRHSSSTTFGNPSNNNQKSTNASAKSPPTMSASNSKWSPNGSRNASGNDGQQGDEENGLGAAAPPADDGAGYGSNAPSNKKRRNLFIALAATVVLVAVVGIACGVVLGGKGNGSNGNGSATSNTSAQNTNKVGTGGGASSGGAGMNNDEQEELFSSMQDGYAQQQTNDDGEGDGASDGDVRPPNANQPDPAQDSDDEDFEDDRDAEDTSAGTLPTDNANDDTDAQLPSCIDDPTWLVVVGDRYGKSVFTPYGCEWVATDPRENCNTVGATPSVSSINRIGEVATAGWIACPNACGGCSGEDGSGGDGDDESLQDDPAEDLSLTVGTVFESSPTSSKPTPTPTKRPTHKPTRAPIPAPMPRPVPSPTFGKVTSDADNAITCKSTAVDTNADEISLPFLPGVAIGSVDATVLGEASGLVASTGGLNPGVLWTHNDAPKFPNRPNNRNRIYAIDTHSYGDVIAAYSLQDAKNIDWEDIAYGNGPDAGVKYLYLGDIGDNDEVRREIYIYRVKEPDISAGGSPFLTEWERLTLTYPDRRSRNVEAFLFDPVDEIFYLMTKTGGYIFSTPAKWGRGSTSMTLKQAGMMSEFRKQPLVGADISPDGKEILLKYYGSVKYFCRESESESVAEVFQTHDSLKLSYDRDNEPKGEAVAWAKEGFYTLSEQDRHATTPLYFYKRSGQ